MNDSVITRADHGRRIAIRSKALPVAIIGRDPDREALRMKIAGSEQMTGNTASDSRKM
jgi:hypothetical protein